jgi:hypothetical protein
MQFLGANPPVGTRIVYRLGAKADSVRLVVRDPAGATVREIAGDSLKAKLHEGLHTVLWDLRAQPIPRASRRPAPGGGFGFFGGGGPEGTPGPVVMPGTYRVTLVVNGADVATKPVEVRGDPDVEITDDDRRARQTLLVELQRIQASVSDAADAARTADEQLRAVKKELADSTEVPAALRAALDSVTKELDPLRRMLGIRDPDEPTTFDFAEFMKMLPIRAAMLSGNVGGIMAPPTEADLRRAADLRREVPAAVDSVNRFLDRLKGLYRRLADAGLYPPVPKAVKSP